MNSAWFVLFSARGRSVDYFAHTTFARLSSFLSCLAVLASFVGACLIFARKEEATASLNWIEFPGLFVVPFGLFWTI